MDDNLPCRAWSLLSAQGSEMCLGGTVGGGTRQSGVPHTKGLEGEAWDGQVCEPELEVLEGQGYLSCQKRAVSGECDVVVSHICRVAMNGHCNWACLQTNVPTLKRNPTEKLDFLFAQKKKLEGVHFHRRALRGMMRKWEHGVALLLRAGGRGAGGGSNVSDL